MSKQAITKMLVGFICLAAIFLTGLYVGRNAGLIGFTVTTQYELGAIDEAEVQALADQLRPDDPAPDEPPDENASDQDTRLNINTANRDDFIALPGIGTTLADRIIAHREAHGPFRTIEELTDVLGIGEQRIADIRDKITVGE